MPPSGWTPAWEPQSGLGPRCRLPQLCPHGQRAGRRAWTSFPPTLCWRNSLTAAISFLGRLWRKQVGAAGRWRRYVLVLQMGSPRPRESSSPDPRDLWQLLLSLETVMPLTLALAGHYSSWEGSWKILLPSFPVHPSLSLGAKKSDRQAAEGQELLGPPPNLAGCPGGGPSLLQIARCLSFPKECSSSLAPVPGKVHQCGNGS